MRRPIQLPKLLKLRARDGPIPTNLATETSVLAKLPDADLREVEFCRSLGGGEVFGTHGRKYIGSGGSGQVDFKQTRHSQQ